MDAVDDTASQLGGGESGFAEADASSCLTVLIDLHSEGWSHSEVSLWDVLANLMVLLNSHMALDSANELVIIGYDGLGAKVLFSTMDDRPRPTDVLHVSGTMIRQFKSLDESVLTAIKNELELVARAHSAKSTSVAGPLSLALAYMNRRLASEAGSPQAGHILVVSAEPEHIGSKYIPAMNSIFTAQKLRVPVDVANFGPPKSFLQQAADFTGGSYLELRGVKEGLVAIFASSFLVSPAVRKYVNLATKPDVDFSAVCFVTKKIVEIGYVCSVCLCIMESVPADRECPVCSTHYEN